MPGIAVNTLNGLSHLITIIALKLFVFCTEEETSVTHTLYDCLGTSQKSTANPL